MSKASKLSRRRAEKIDIGKLREALAPKTEQVWTIRFTDGVSVATVDKGVAGAAMRRLGADVASVEVEKRPIQ